MWPVTSQKSPLTCTPATSAFTDRHGNGKTMEGIQESRTFYSPRTNPNDTQHSETRPQGTQSLRLYKTPTVQAVLSETIATLLEKYTAKILYIAQMVNP